MQSRCAAPPVPCRDVASSLEEASEGQLVAVIPGRWGMELQDQRKCFSVPSFLSHSIGYGRNVLKFLAALSNERQECSDVPS